MRDLGPMPTELRDGLVEPHRGAGARLATPSRGPTPAPAPFRGAPPSGFAPADPALTYRPKGKGKGKGKGGKSRPPPHGKGKGYGKGGKGDGKAQGSPPSKGGKDGKGSRDGKSRSPAPSRWS